MRELFGCAISPAALRTVGQKCSYRLINTELRIKSELRQADVLGADETRVRVGGKNHWVHATRAEKLTHYRYDTRLGEAATGAINILTEYKGTLVGDGWYSYDQLLQCNHGLCNAHLLREMIYVGEVDERQRQWTEMMIVLMLEIKTEVERVRAGGEEYIDQERQDKYLSRYERVIMSAIKINAPPKDEGGEEGVARCEEAELL